MCERDNTTYNRYKTKSIHNNVDEILNMLLQEAKKEDPRMMFDGVEVKTKSLRYEAFKKDLTCCKCGIKGNVMALQNNSNSERYHFNLYNLNNGIYTLMTKDHILPKSRGGEDVIDNMQTMCMYCNAEKGNTIEVEKN